MGQVMIKCPNTEQMVPTGIDMDKASFESSEMSDNSVQCPACGQMHTWQKSDATVGD